ncbi:MAG: single-stranded-DNA-specific exonuclease RecJ [Clostridium saudiense]|uniref:Single-stranded-DNA-specific exonuclease RecJ n=1 Tax=Clostridium disporicum TaxID=84024 RepID=A0A173XGB5_9CLOT|nr:MULTISPECIES: single-stranded-DNA-specific exonuclease RecJ [Clostridium]CUN50340.1 ssDNA exonuclease%2C RecJ [Clostridium disporicum]
MVRNVKFDTVKFAQQLGISDTVAKLMVNRGIYNLDIAKEYLSSSIGELHNPTDMLGMSGAVELMRNSIIKGEKILIVGDYDVDGVISTYVLYTAISKCGGNVSFHIPDRIKEGYGINESIIKKASEDNIDIIITCDNGIAAIEQVKLAKELGIKVIITDHHDVPFIEEDNVRKYVVPEADYVLNPKQENCNYEFDKICGAGVAYKFVQCLYKEFNIPNEELYDLIQYVAIATVCDVVDLVSENRILVKEGLKRINNTSNIGLRALFKETGLEGKEITVYSLGFVIGPSINASGRLEQAEWALKLLITKDKNEAEELAKKLNELNKDRQELTQTGLEEAIKIIEANNMAKDKVLVVYLEDVHESIAGIIAGRIREKYNLPTIILTKAHEGAKGSGRSIEEYNMFEELLKCKDLLGKFGGHPMAAGMSIPSENIDKFREKLNEVTTLSDEDIIPKVSIDMPLPINKINYKLIDEIALLEPYGKGNPKPNFAVKGLMVKAARILGKNNNVLKLNLTDGYLNIDGIYFGDIEVALEIIKNKFGEYEYNKMLNGQTNMVKIDIVYFPDINEYNGRKSVQLLIQNIRV